MKLGVFTVLLGAQPLRQACEYLAKSGVQAVEIGCGGNPGKAHCDPKALLADPAKLAEPITAWSWRRCPCMATACIPTPPWPRRPTTIFSTPAAWPRPWGRGES